MGSSPEKQVMRLFLNDKKVEMVIPALLENRQRSLFCELCENFGATDSEVGSRIVQNFEQINIFGGSGDGQELPVFS